MTCKLIKYSLFIFLFTHLSHGYTQSNIITGQTDSINYINIIPDIVCYEDSGFILNINLDSDESLEFEFSGGNSHETISGLHYASIWSNCLVVNPAFEIAVVPLNITLTDTSHVFGFNNGDTIKSDHPDYIWSKSFNLMKILVSCHSGSNFSICTGFWGGEENYYLAFRRVSEIDTLYGWLNLSFDYYRLQLYDVAYQGNIDSLSVIKDYFPPIFDKILPLVRPNPAHDFINLLWQDPDGNYFIYDSKGVLVRSGQLNSLINIEDLEKGIYIITVTLEDKSLSEKFIKN
ncbi:MAG: T9SS type A sorting domain-containing protein [Fimbriimonadaceae bacterium]|nr:T9SS type A sorting domain-containing protein [Chitinophagales bacterium]